MEVSVRRAGTVTLLDLHGNVTLGGADETLRRVVQEVAHGGAKIVVNLAAVPYMDSAGLGGLVHCRKLASAAGAEIKLLNPSRRVYDLLHVVNLDSVFECFTDEAAALASFGEPEA